MFTVQKQVLATGFFLFSLLCPLKSFAATFSGVYVFGDSLSDPENTRNQTALLNSQIPIIPIIPPSQLGYSNGRFSNGPNWVDYLTDKLEVNPTPFTQVLGGVSPTQGINFAYGGATTTDDNTILPAPLLPGLQQQIGWFTSLIPPNTTADAKALYILWAGANDYLPTESLTFKPFTTADTTLANLTGAVTTLAGVGAKNILVVNLPSLGKVPKVLGTDDSQRLNDLTGEHNLGLAQNLDSLRQNLGPTVNLLSLDINTVFEQIVANPGQFNYKNASAPCLGNPACTNPDEFFFWDPIHPTTAGHRQIGELAYSVLTKPAERVPEPGSGVGILAFGVLGTVAVLKRKQQKKGCRV
jgi:phospholipase/lecithinase/hemolysin